MSSVAVQRPDKCLDSNELQAAWLLTLTHIVDHLAPRRGGCTAGIVGGIAHAIPRWRLARQRAREYSPVTCSSVEGNLIDSTDCRSLKRHIHRLSPCKRDFNRVRLSSVPDATATRIPANSPIHRYQ